MDSNQDSTIRALCAHAGQFGSGFLCDRDGHLPEAAHDPDFVPPQSFLTFIEDLPDALLNAGCYTRSTSYAETGLVPFYQDGFGNACLFDSRHPMRNGEFPIMHMNHDVPGMDPEVPEPLVADFPEWLQIFVHGEIAGQCETQKGGIGCVLVLVAWGASLLGWASRIVGNWG